MVLEAQVNTKQLLSYVGDEFEEFDKKYGVIFGDIGRDINSNTLICVYEYPVDQSIDDDGVMHISRDSFLSVFVMFMKCFKKLRKDKSLENFFDNLFNDMTRNNYGNTCTS